MVAKPHAITHRPCTTRKKQFPAGLFVILPWRHLSAILFSKAGTISKINLWVSSRDCDAGPVDGARRVILFDRTPGELQSIPFELDILATIIRQCGQGGELGVRSLDVYHNLSPATLIPL